MLLALEVEGKKSMQVTKTELEQPKQCYPGTAFIARPRASFTETLYTILRAIIMMDT